MGGWYVRSFTIVLLLSVGMHFAHTFADVQALQVEEPVISKLIRRDMDVSAETLRHGRSIYGSEICLVESEYARASSHCILSTATLPITTSADSHPGPVLKRMHNFAITSSVAEFTVLLAIVVVISL